MDHNQIPTISKLENIIVNLHETLCQREEQYGTFKDIAEDQHTILQTIRGAKGYQHLPPSTILALEMIIHKIIRLVNSGKESKDTLTDIAGYALRALEVMEK